jgi:hypothetical protein
MTIEVIDRKENPMTAIEITPTETSAMPAEFDPAMAEAFGQAMIGILGGGLLACARGGWHHRRTRSRMPPARCAPSGPAAPISTEST